MSDEVGGSGTVNFAYRQWLLEPSLAWHGMYVNHSQFSRIIPHR